MTDANEIEKEFGALAVRPEPIAEETVREALRTQYGLAGEVTSLRGERDTNFLISIAGEPRYVLRVASVAERPVIAEFRAAELLHLEQAAPDLPIPRLQRTLTGATGFDLSTESGLRRGQLVTYMPGIPMASMPDAKRQFPHLGEVAAMMARALATFDHPGSRYPLLWDIAQLPQAAKLIVHTRDSEHRHLVTWAIEGHRSIADQLRNARRQVIHNDLNPHNIMMDPASESVTGIIDFGDSIHSHLVNDVAVACSYILDEGDDPLAPACDLLGAYCRILPLTREEISLLPALIAARHALTILITNWRAALYPDNSAYILRNQPSSLRGLRGLHALSPQRARDELFAAVEGIMS